MALFLLSAVLCVASALTGIQSFDYDSHTGMTITYWRGYWRTQSDTRKTTAARMML
jgi:hypothetical protein